MKKTRKIRKIGCSKINFLGSRIPSQTRNYKIAKRVKNTVGDPLIIQKFKDTSLQSYCEHRDWMTEDKKAKRMGGCPNIPLFEMVKDMKHKQFVLGRMSNLRDYYDCQKYFYTLNNKDWDSLYQLNDLFVYCGTHYVEDPFPIRIVTDPNGGIRSKHSKYGFTQYNKYVITLPQIGQSKKDRITILSRELCQVSTYFQFRIYQSLDEPTIFFASKTATKKDIKQWRLREVFIA
jgi:hypothetical protein